MNSMSAYLLWMGGSSLIAAGVHFLISSSLRKRAMNTLLTWALGIALGVVCAKACYIVTSIIEHLMSTGLSTFSFTDKLWSADIHDFLFFGGALGVCLGAALAGKLTGNAPMKALNAYAPAGALMAGMARFGEGFWGRLGTGALIENQSLRFFPLAKTIEYDGGYKEGYLAVFMLSGLACLIVCALSLRLFKQDRFLRTLFYLCLPLILLESLRDASMTVHEFVKVEQLLSMVVVEVILILYGARGKNWKYRFVPAAVGLAMAGLFVAAEFAIQGKLFNSVDPDWEEGFLRHAYAEEYAWQEEDGGTIVPLLGYVVMILGLGVLAWMEILGRRHLDRSVKA